MKGVLADTSAWIAHFREPDPVIADAIHGDQLWTHEYVIGELALGSIPNRKGFLANLSVFKQVGSQPAMELLDFVEEQGLAATGIGLVDASLLLSLTMTKEVLLWTRDKRLAQQAERLGLLHSPD